MEDERSSRKEGFPGFWIRQPGEWWNQKRRNRLQENGDEQMYAEQAGLELHMGHQGGEVHRLADIEFYSKFKAGGVCLRVAEAMEWMRSD